MKMRSRMKRLDWLVSWLPSELMNDLSKWVPGTRPVCGSVGRSCYVHHSPITGWIGSARQRSSTFSNCWTGSRPLVSLKSNERARKRRVGGLCLLSLYLYFASRCPPVSQLTTLMMILSLSPQLATNLSSIFRHLLIIIPIPTIPQLAQKIQRHPSTHNVPVYELIPT